MSTPSSEWYDGALEVPVGEFRKGIYFLNLYRCAQALVYLLLLSGLLEGEDELSLQPALHNLAGVLYLLFAVWVVTASRLWLRHFPESAYTGILIDILAAGLIILAIPHMYLGITIMLAVTLGAGGLLLTPRLALFFAATATLAGFAVRIWTRDGSTDLANDLFDAGLFGLVYFAFTIFCSVLGRQLRDTAQVARVRGIHLADMAQINELTIRRMKTGVVVLDGSNRIQLMNEAAWLLLGNPPQQRDFARVAPIVMRRMARWRETDQQDPTPFAAADGMPQISVYFSRLRTASGPRTVLFIDDTGPSARRAEELTISTLGRLSASVAHEIRNPLTAISYAVQLLEESEGLGVVERHLVDIISSNGRRLNQIVENTLGLARQKMSRAEIIDVDLFLERFVHEYVESSSLGEDSVRHVPAAGPIRAVVDPRQLQQVVWNLVQNARRHGHLPNQPARIRLSAGINESGAVQVEVTDRGPGIPQPAAERAFDPFYTTTEDGTGLGLYLARQLCQVNQGRLDYVAPVGGGGCFRITLAPPLLRSGTATARGGYDGEDGDTARISA